MKQYWKYLLFALAATAIVVAGVTVPEFRSPIPDAKVLLIVCAQICAVGLVSFLLITAAGVSRWLFAVFYPVYLLAGVALSYYRIAYHVTLTPLLLDCIAHTNASEASDVVGAGLILSLLAAAVVASLMVYWRWHLQQPRGRVLLFAAALLLLYGYTHASERLHLALMQRYPACVWKSVEGYADMQEKRSASHAVPEYRIAEPVDSLCVVLVLGESVRADHLELNGYPRATSPLLSGRSNLVSMPHIRSQYTSTHTSVPVIITRADSIHPDRQYSESSMCAVYRDAGFYTAWLSNNEPSNSFVAYTDECDTTLFVNAGKSVFVQAQWSDSEILPHFDNLLSLQSPRCMLVLHTIGSHWYYDNHYPEHFRRFAPTTTSRVVADNTPEQLINSYDNSVLYADWFLDQVILRLEHRNAVMIYLSDHGESMGEEGRWLHAHENEELKNPACIVWYSDAFAEQFPEKVQALRSNAGKPYLTDFLFPSILAIGGMEMPDADSYLNIFNTTDQIIASEDEN